MLSLWLLKNDAYIGLKQMAGLESGLKRSTVRPIASSLSALVTGLEGGKKVLNGFVYSGILFGNQSEAVGGLINCNIVAVGRTF